MQSYKRVVRYMEECVYISMLDSLLELLNDIVAPCRLGVVRMNNLFVHVVGRRGPGALALA